MSVVGCLFTQVNVLDVLNRSKCSYRWNIIDANPDFLYYLSKEHMFNLKDRCLLEIMHDFNTSNPTNMLLFYCPRLQSQELHNY